MEHSVSIQKYQKSWVFVFLLCGIEFILAGIWTACIPGDADKGVLWGISLRRLIMLGFIFLTSSFFFLLAVLAVRNPLQINQQIQTLTKNKVSQALFLLFFVAGWIELLAEPSLFYPYEGFFFRLKPIMLAAGVVSAQFWVWQWKLSKQRSDWKPLRRFLHYRPTWFFFILFLFLIVLTLGARFGMMKETPLWNVPGIPVNSFQFLFIFLFLILLTVHLSNKKNFTGINERFVFPLLIFLVAVFIWGLTPLKRQYFFLQPSMPAFQPFPYSDARVHDLGALSILNGQGVFFHGYTDKPFMMVLLACFHLFFDRNYVLIQWLSVFFFALMPVIVYCLGRRFHSAVFGLSVAVILIIQQRNAIVLSNDVITANVKLMMSEVPVLFGTIVLTLLLFKWSKQPDACTSLLVGGCLGILGLTRMNPLLFLPVAIALFLFHFRKAVKKAVRPLLWLMLGFTMIFGPWLVCGTNHNGTPWMIVKLQDVLDHRIRVNIQSSVVPDSQLQPVASLQGAGVRAPLNPAFRLETGSDDNALFVYADLFISHFWHNGLTALMALPDGWRYERVKVTASRPYWDDAYPWKGDLPAPQIAAILINVALISFGFTAAWHRHRWAGLIPALIFITYDLALSFSFTSGGRYIVPINWIVFFYYILGWLTLFQMFFRILQNIPECSQAENSSSSRVADIPASNIKRLVSSLICLTLIGSLLPMASFILPDFIKTPFQQQPSSLFAASGIQPDTRLTYQISQLVYPYYYEEENLFDYTLIFSQDFRNDNLIPGEDTHDWENWPQDGQWSVTGSDTNQVVKQIYFLSEDQQHLTLFWSDPAYQP